MTTNEIISFSYVLIALHQNQIVIIIFLKDELIRESHIVLTIIQAVGTTGPRETSKNPRQLQK